ncbi:hypothetical protein [Micromonospora sp. NBC_01739]|uniref:hypothetical protein n=1 Tax=unclassified Micromonospora TaxID=2617518 RepID=UPI002E16426B|nr:hypothetical protein OIE53_19800 [Micromonospora sp. NBC_01739]
MISVYRFRLTDVLELAEHAATAHTAAVDDESDGPVLLLVTDDSAYLTCNGLPAAPSGPEQAATCPVQAVYAEHAGHNPPGHTGDDLLVTLPLRRADARLVDELRAAASHGHSTLVITVVDGTVGLSTVTVPTPPGPPPVD